MVCTDDGKRTAASFIGNFSVQYNFQSASLAVAILVSTYQGAALYPEPGWAKEMLLGDVFVGATSGMLVMGRLGDLWGRQRAMVLTHALVFIGALGSAVASVGDVVSVYAVMAGFRFMLGVGVGGIYPLSAVVASESDVGMKSVMAVAWSFFWQTPGQFAPYVVGWVISPLPHADMFRIVLGLGAVPALFVMYFAYTTPERASIPELSSPRGAAREVEQRRGRISDNMWKLIGTGGSWFLYDVAFYGTAVFTPSILADIFGKHTSVHELCVQTIIVLAMQFPGMLFSIALLRYVDIDLRTLQMAGFAIICVMFSVFAVVEDTPSTKWNRFAVLCLLNLSLSFGPNLTTYIYPTQCFPRESASTYHGISAASGKVGAVCGAFLFPTLDQVSIVDVVTLQAVIAALAVVVTFVFCPKVRMYSGGCAQTDELLAPGA